MTFFARLTAASSHHESLLCIGLDPNPAQIPQRYRQSGNDLAGMENWINAVIEQTDNLVCCYKPNIAFFEAMGAPGMDLLRRTLDRIPEDIPVLLDAKRGDIGSTAAAYAQACFDDLGVDAVTLSPYLGRDSIEPFAAFGGKGLFVLCHTSNPSAEEFQHLEINDWRSLDREPNQPLYIRVAKNAIEWSPNIGLVVGATYPTAMAAIRNVAPDTWFLVPGIGAQGGDLGATLAAGLRTDGSGLIINVSRGVCLADDHRAAAEEIRAEIEAHRAHARQTMSANFANIGPVDRFQDLVSDLAELGAVNFGDFTLAGGTQSPIYIDLRLLVSQPSLLAQAAEAYADIVVSLACDRVAGVPYAALPIGTAVALVADIPLIYPRKEAKTHGLGKEIEGSWEPGDRVVIVEDLITSGASTIATAERLRAAGLVVEDAVVLIDREQGGATNLSAAGIRVHSVLTLTNILDILVDAGKLDGAKRAEVTAFVKRSA